MLYCTGKRYGKEGIGTEDFALALLEWFDREKRPMPWRETKDPYRIWLSEIMLQQTRVDTVRGYYERFLRAFPTVAHLAKATEEEVLKEWQGLGYYSRARNLHRAAQEILRQWNGVFPDSYDAILSLTGIGPYTAGAVASIAFDRQVPAIDGNVYRAASRLFGIRENIERPSVQRDIRDAVLSQMPSERPGDYNQALMELGATLCVPGTPDCARCPLSSRCDAREAGDAADLPYHEKKAPPKPVQVAVCILEHHGKILVTRRSERLLKGLYVFVLIENETPDALPEVLSADGLQVSELTNAGNARHVFTHRIWEMTLYRGNLTLPPGPPFTEREDYRLVSREELRALPTPTAMKAALRLIEADELRI